MKRYVAVIDHEDGKFGASFPDAPGCTAMGETEDEVIRNATEALSEWVADELAAGREIPEPRSYLQLLKAKEYGVGQGGMVASIPLILETGQVVRINVSIDQGLLTAIDQYVEEKGLSRSAFLSAVARERIKA